MTDILILQRAIAGLATGDVQDRVIGTKTSGPAGVDAVLEYNGIYLNFREWIDTFVVTEIQGTDDADVRDSRTQNPTHHGETPGKSLYGGRTIVLSGYIETKTIWKLRDMQQGLRAAFADVSTERPLVVRTANPDYDLQIYCKKSQKINMPEKQDSPSRFKRDFQIMLRASYPWFTSVREEFFSAVLSTGSYDEIAFTVINLGNFQSMPKFELAGPMNAGTVIVNEKNSNFIELTAAIPNGETWAIENASGKMRVYRTSDGANRWEYVSVL